MDLTWINVVDTAVKIGLGATISALSGYIVLIKSQRHEIHKEQRKFFYNLQEEKKSKYVEFLFLSQKLTQTYLYTSCSPSSDDYSQYIRSFNELQIVSDDTIRIKAFDIMHSVQLFSCMNKTNLEPKIKDEILADTREKISLFQKIVQQEVTKQYKEK